LRTARPKSGGSWKSAAISEATGSAAISEATESAAISEATGSAAISEALSVESVAISVARPDATKFKIQIL
jgi:hypothetical protein